MSFSLQEILFPAFLLLMPVLSLEILGFDWKSTEFFTYFMGFAFGALFGLCLS